VSDWEKRPQRRWASPVIVTKGDGTTQQVSAEEFRARQDEAIADTIPEITDFSQEILEEEIRKTLIAVMRHSLKLNERTAAATAGVKYMAAKSRMGDFGSGLDDDPDEKD
jgi:hypothetical protein